MHGFDVGVLAEMFARPEFGPTQASTMPAIYFAVLFFVATALFLPGVLQGYASTYRLPREDFFRACGRNLWRFIRLLIVAGIVMGIVAGVLFGIQRRAGESGGREHERIASSLSFVWQFVRDFPGDERSAHLVRSGAGGRGSERSAGGAKVDWRGVPAHVARLGRLLWKLHRGHRLFAAIVLVAGIWVWMKFVPPASVVGAFFVSQLTLLLLLIPRFWQRGVAVTYYLQNMVQPIEVVETVTSVTVVAPVVPSTPPETQAS